jgi:hypothetical protein
MNDPLKKNGSDPARLLFEELARHSTGFTQVDVMTAAGNLIVNVLRQSTPTWQKAELKLDELVGTIKTVLSQHYDKVTDKRHSLIPYTQNITVPFIKFENTFPGSKH